MGNTILTILTQVSKRETMGINMDFSNANEAFFLRTQECAWELKDVSAKRFTFKEITYRNIVSFYKKEFKQTCIAPHIAKEISSYGLTLDAKIIFSYDMYYGCTGTSLYKCPTLEAIEAKRTQSYLPTTIHCDLDIDGFPLYPFGIGGNRAIWSIILYAIACMKIKPC